jgi:cation transport regulator ChaB
MGCGASSKSTAPHLDTYFKALGDHTKKAAKSLTSGADPLGEAMAMATDPARQEKAKRDQEKFHQKIKGTIEKSFDHHDIDGNGVLSVQESQKFFSNYIERQALFQDQMGAFQAQQSQDMGLKMMSKMMGGDMPKQVKQQLKDKAKEQINKTKELMVQALDEYEKDKEKFDKDAFTAIDTRKDGQLAKDEVVSALLPGTPENMIFLDAFPTGPSHLMKKAMAEIDAAMAAMPDADAECQQQ